MKNVGRAAWALTACLLVVTGCSESRAKTAPAAPSLELDSKVKLVAYTGCDQMLTDLRTAAAKHVTAWGLWPIVPAAMNREDVAGKSTTDVPDHSTTNVNEAGVDEPDLVKTDGKRVITFSQGVLRVVDTATRKVTGSLRLVPKAQSWAQADLLISGDRALVLFQGGGIVPFGAVAKMPAGYDGPQYVLVDLAGTPKVISTMSVRGAYVDARQVGSTVRVVVRSVPEIAFSSTWKNEKKALKANRETIMAAPIEAWQPQYTIDGATSRVGCDRISHPDAYTGTSLLTVYTFDLAAGFNSAPPISVAADGDTVYGTATSLYVTSNPSWWIQADKDPETTEIHRFDVSTPGSPTYVASGEVPGRLLNQYSLSEYEGHLRVATTGPKDSGVYVLDAARLARLGQVTGLGHGERIYSVRFIGYAGYVVSFRQVDPLYTIDLRDPGKPAVTGELELTGYSAYLHPSGDGRLLGIGQEATAKGRTLGTQVSLFDVADPAHPKILSRYVKQDSTTDAEWDPHAFLYWPKSGLAMVPLVTWGKNWSEPTKALVLHVTDDAITEVGTITHPWVEPHGEFAPPDPSIKRCLIIGDTMWTVSDLGLRVTDSATLAQKAWIPFH
ncbi:beta-propeller domain-containing protein [Streptosporangiaceae bacterium NEAU-GS5]|nr:beta-propeller domain-containing protein [Streptosporangiaceae bacterium NEAU-GS5]